MKLRELTEADVEFTLECQPEEIDYVGNCLASGDDEEDKQAEEWIREQLDNGNEWAWCCVKVTARWDGFEASKYLGGCSYRSEKDFREGGYFDDMKAQSLESLNAQLEKTDKAIKALRKASRT